MGLGAPSIGAIVACGGVGGVLGGLLATRLAERFGRGQPIVLGMVGLAAMHLVAPATFGPPPVSVPVLATVGLLAQLSVAVMSINRTSLIQQLVPAHALGRVAATQQVVVLAAVPVGATLGGLIAESIGLRATLAIAAVGTVVATVPLLRSALWTLDASAAEAPAERPATPAAPSDEPPMVERQLKHVLLGDLPRVPRQDQLGNAVQQTVSPRRVESPVPRTRQQQQPVLVRGVRLRPGVPQDDEWLEEARLIQLQARGRDLVCSR